MFVKLFRSILDSTIWMEEDHVLRIWLVLLLNCDSEGIVKMPIPAMAQRARVTLDQCREALTRLEAPDPDSQSKEEDGKRIVKISEEEPIWFIVNYETYRRIRNEEQRKEYHRNYMREYRARKKAENESQSVKFCEPLSTQVEEEGEEEEDIHEGAKPPRRTGGTGSSGKKKTHSRFLPPTLAEVQAHMIEKGYHFDPERFIAHYASKGWMIGKSKMKNWKMACVTFEKNWLDDHPQKGDDYFQRHMKELDEEENKSA